MAVFQIDQQVFQTLPQVCFGVVVARGIDNGKPYPEIADRLKQEADALRARMEGENLKEHTGIVPYRDAFQRLGINPNKYPCSVEALCKRVLKGADLPSINPIVDLGNAVSLKYLLPMGAHDIDKLSENLDVRFSRPGDTFVPFGAEEAEAPDAGELIYASGDTVKTRRWIWRQSEGGKIDPGSSNVVFPIDGFLDRNHQAVLEAQKELAGLLEKFFGCGVTTALLTAENPSVTLE